jgi:hypothetical protein
MVRTGTTKTKARGKAVKKGLSVAVSIAKKRWR